MSCWLYFPFPLCTSDFPFLFIHSFLLSSFRYSFIPIFPFSVTHSVLIFLFPNSFTLTFPFFRNPLCPQFPFSPFRFFHSHFLLSASPSVLFPSSLNIFPFHVSPSLLLSPFPNYFIQFFPFPLTPSLQLLCFFSTLCMYSSLSLTSRILLSLHQQTRPSYFAIWISHGMHLTVPWCASCVLR